jgi:alpha-L-fucosidase
MEPKLWYAESHSMVYDWISNSSPYQWCDIGGPNKTLEFAAEWYNTAIKAGRGVVMNNRCGAIPDFDTPEYAKFSSIQERKWETSEGIDP